MKNLFSRKTFQYFDLAKKNKKKMEWFTKNKALYEIFHGTQVHSFLLTSNFSSKDLKAA